MKRPAVHKEVLPGGALLLRYKSLDDVSWFEKFKNNPFGHSTYLENTNRVKKYLETRLNITEEKRRIIESIEDDIKNDKDIQKILRLDKTMKRKITKNKFVGNFSPVDYATNKENIFSRHMPGKIKPTLNLAFQVGTISGGNYQAGVTNIIKTVIKLKALGYAVNVDLFDSDTTAGGKDGAYIIVNVINSGEAFDLKKLLVCYHETFFSYTLFNGYAAKDDTLRTSTRIGTFLPSAQVLKDLSPFYSIIGGNLTFGFENTLNNEERKFISELVKIFY